jgi:hypothetical protein
MDELFFANFLMADNSKDMSLFINRSPISTMALRAHGAFK